MKKKILSLINSQWNGVLSLSLGTIISQIINFISQPILTRVLTPSELGQYSYIFSLAQLFIPIASLKLNLLIVTSKTDKEASELTFLSIFSVFIVSFIYIFFIMFNSIFTNYSTGELLLLLFVNPLIIISTGIYYVFMSHDNREQQYNNIAKAEVSKSGLLGIIQITAGLLNLGVIGQLTGRIISPSYYFNDLFKFLSVNFNKIKIKDSLRKRKKYYRHIIYSVPSQFINTFSYTLIMISIVSLYSAEEVGYYSVSVKVLGVPLMLISYNISKVYLQKISKVKANNESLFGIFKYTIKRLFIVSLLFFSLIAIVSPFVTEFIFGRGFQEAGIYITILCFMFSIRLVTSSLTGTFVVIEKQNIEMLFQLLFILVGICVYIFAKIFQITMYKYLLLISIFYGLVYFYILMYLAYKCKLLDN